MTTVKNIYDFIDRIAPYDTQEEWDNSGHLIGDFRKEVKRVVMALDVTHEVADFAKEVEADLVLSHHPLIFSGIKAIKSDSVPYKLVNNGIAHICCHTNFDKAVGGINDSLAEILGLNDCRKAENGFTVVGTLECEMSIDDFAQYVADKLDCAGIRYTDTEKTIKSVAVCGGAGDDEFIEDAMTVADCFLTGDLKYHQMLDAQQMGMCVISAGHFETENAPFLSLKDKLEGVFCDVEFIVAPQENPIKTI